MLSKTDHCTNLRQIHFLSLLGILPVTVKGGRLSASKSYKTLSLCVFYMVLVQSHIIYSAFLTVDKLKRGWGEALPTISLDYVFVPCIQLCLFTGFVNFILHCDEVCEIFNGCMIHECNLVGVKSSFLNWRRFSFIDLIAQLLPIMIDAFVVLFPIICALTRTLPAFHGTSLLGQVLAVGIDVLVTLCFTEWAYFAILLQILFTEKASYFLQREILMAK